MLKKLIKTAIVGSTLLGLAASANADTININLYGASAQYKFWSAAAGEFLEDQGCDAGDVYSASDNDKYGITMCDDLDGDVVYIRYSSKASYDGIRSVQGLDPDGVAAADGCAANERMMADETAVTWSAGGGATTGLDADYDLTCKDVTIGASDVAAETFGQESHGDLLGPKQNGGWEDREIFDITIDGDLYNDYRPIVVPFAFFRNANTTSPVPFDNMSRLMATSIFSGQVTNWDQFGTDDDGDTIASLPLVVCLRHAGSGTHATLDAAIMRGDYGLLTYEALPSSWEVQNGYSPAVYFNDGSSDEMRCVGGGDISGYDGIGAVGYADADKVEMDAGTGEYHGSKGDIKLMTWMGVPAEKANIVKGKYDFWSAQWLYASSSEDEDTAALITALVAFASDPANLAITGKGDYWAAQDEMEVEKTTDFTYPHFK